jgi:3-deoxy-manno-octulosonate cytidylyltransferase (CMP-KDO synthetase)
MIAWVVDAARKAKRLERVFVATDHEGIAKAARDAGAEVVMTSPDCASGTDRVAEAAREAEADVYINVQGDEPAVDPRDLDLLVAAFDRVPVPDMATLARPVGGARELWSPDVVKVVRAASGDALYFSRSPIPFYRDAWDGTRGVVAPQGGPVPLTHIGVYGYTRAALFSFPKLSPGVLEVAERLEQLRALEAGWRIRVIDAVGEPGVGVDRPEDVKRAEEELRRRVFFQA